MTDAKPKRFRLNKKTEATATEPVSVPATESTTTETAPVVRKDKVKLNIQVFDDVVAKTIEHFKLDEKEFRKVMHDMLPSVSMYKRNRKSPKVKTDIAKPTSAYLFFTKENRSKIATELSIQKDFNAIAKAVSARWKALTPEERLPYDQRAAESKQTFETAKMAAIAKMASQAPPVETAPVATTSEVPTEASAPVPTKQRAKRVKA